MTVFETVPLPDEFDVLAPDGSEVRVLAGLAGGGMAHFTLPAGRISRAIRHRTVEEIWYILSGRGEMWRAIGRDETITVLAPGTCLTIPLGMNFQFRALGDAPLEAVAITMPPWPGDDEAEFVAGPWRPTAASAA